MTARSKDSLALLSFRHLAQDLYINPSSLDYRHEVGEGEFAIVEKGVYKKKNGDEHEVAVKSFKPHVVATPTDLRELFLAASHLTRVQHKHIARFHGIGCFSPESAESIRASVFFVEEFIGGYSFSKLLTEQMRNPYHKLYNTELALQWCIQLAEALEYLHTTDPPTTHGDVKSENVFLTDEQMQDTEVRLVDLKPHKHVYEKSTGAAVNGSHRQQASLMAASAGQQSVCVEDSAHDSGLGRTQSLTLQQQAHLFFLDPPIEKPSKPRARLPMTMSSPDLQFLASHYSPKKPPRSALKSSHASPPRAYQTGDNTNMPSPPPSPTDSDPDNDTRQQDDQIISRSASWGVLEELAMMRGSLDPITAAPDPISTSSPNLSPESLSLSRTKAQQAAQQDLISRLPPARHQMECKQHGASRAFAALKAIHVIKEETPTHVAASTTGAQDPNPSNSRSGRRVTFSHKMPEGKTSSRAWGMLYRAPEISKGQKYNEKVDVFSFGVVMYELLSRALISGWSNSQPDQDMALIRYAEQVADGYREPIPSTWPLPVQELISSCWHDEPSMRPRMSDVLATLQQLAADPLIAAAMDHIKVTPKNYRSTSCTCTIS